MGLLVIFVMILILSGPMYLRRSVGTTTDRSDLIRLNLESGDTFYAKTATGSDRRLRRSPAEKLSLACVK